MANNTGIVGSNPVNQADAKQVRTRSKFDLSYHLFDTHRFGEYHPHFVMEAVAGDSISLRSQHNIRSYTLGSPLMQSIRMNKDYFNVPMEAIMPHTWELIFTNPTLGDDVPDDANCILDLGVVFSGLRAIVDTFENLDYTALCTSEEIEGETVYTPDKDKTEKYFTVLLKSFLLFESFFSNGSLLSSLGCHLSDYFKYTLEDESEVVNLSFDSFFDGSLYELFSEYFKKFIFDFDGGDIRLSGDDVSIRNILEYCRDYPDFVISFIDYIRPDVDVLETHISSIQSVFSNITIKEADFTINLSRPLAYQLVCAHYFSNDAVDFIYSAQLFRDSIHGLIMDCPMLSADYGYGRPPFFEMNGNKIPYDAFSQYFLEHMFYFYSYEYPEGSGFQRWFVNHLGVDSLDWEHFFDIPYIIWQTILSYRRSLRYLDYFTGSKSRPLAVGNINIPVGADSTVNVIDVTQNIQKQRFLNAVNRSGRKFSNYLKEIFGTAPAPDYHNPFFLGHTSDSIFGSEVENTGSAQLEEPNSVTSVLRSNGSKYEFTFEADRPCIVIGVTSYDVPRSYSTNIERHYFHKDRFDMFNPFFQFVGDQSVYMAELYPAMNSMDLDDIFGYQIRNSEYKQRVNMASGGFVENLPGYAFLSHDDRKNTHYLSLNISPDYIRSLASELDQYYVSLTGYSLGSYFHFICDNFNECSASRPMAFTPNIL